MNPVSENSLITPAVASNVMGQMAELDRLGAERTAQIEFKKKYTVDGAVLREGLFVYYMFDPGYQARICLRNGLGSSVQIIRRDPSNRRKWIKVWAESTELYYEQHKAFNAKMLKYQRVINDIDKEIRELEEKRKFRVELRLQVEDEFGRALKKKYKRKNQPFYNVEMKSEKYRDKRKKDK